MPDVKVCLWNIQNYGRIAPKYDGPTQVGGNALRNEFIARFVRRHEIDVLMIQEVQITPKRALDDLLSWLNMLYPRGFRDWGYSSCGSTISGKWIEQAQNQFDVGFMSGARSEGYAVLWRRSQAARFTLVDGLFPIASLTAPPAVTSPLNISELGRPTGTFTVREKVKTKFRTINKFRATGGFTQPNAYPYDLNTANNKYALLDAWPKLNYPPVSASHYASLVWHGVRRPVYVVLKLGNDATNLCPVAVYHAPSSQMRATWGAFVAGLSREVYATNSVNGNGPQPNQMRALAKTVFGGDFNWPVAYADWPGDYKYFWTLRNKNSDGGANCSVAPAYNRGDAARRTTVQILEGDHTTPINSNDPNDYRRYKIDLAFYFGGVTAERVDLLGEVMDNPDVYRSPIKLAYDVLIKAEKDVDASSEFVKRQMTPTGPQEERNVQRNKKWVKTYVPMISGAWAGTFINWRETKKQFRAGDLTDARRAAEFIHIFISDHLPLVATIPV